MPVKKKPLVDYPDDPDELPYEERLTRAWEDWADSNGKLSMRKAAAQHGIDQWERLRDRIRGMKPKQQEAERRQRLGPREERIIELHILQLEVWGWPPRVAQLRAMAKELLIAKGDPEDPGPKWTQRFMDRHPHLKGRFVPPLDKSRVISEDPDQIARFFELFRTTKEKYNIHDDDVYNMDEKGIMMGVLAKLKVICSRKHSMQRTTQQGSREWVSLIECISSDGRVLSPFVIFKAKLLNKHWYHEFRKEGGGAIAVSDRGWTDDELCLEWFKLIFQPETEKVKKGDYRMLLFDGHGSHLTREVVAFCKEHNIILLCLPAHSTHLLQPCDVGTFLPLADAYRTILLQKTRWGAGYSIDKMMFLSILREARISSLNEHNIKGSWEKTGLFPFNPEIIIGALPAVILQREKEARAHLKPSSRPTTSGQPAPLAVATPADVNSVNLVINVSFKAEFDNLKSTLGPDLSTKQQLFLKNMETVVEKLGNSAIAAITESVLIQGVNKELIDSADYQKNRKKASGKDADKISDARVLSLEGMDEAVRIKAAKRKEEEEKRAKQKRLNKLDAQWKSLATTTFTSFRRWGPDILEEVEDKTILGERLLQAREKAIKALKTPKATKTKPPLIPLITPRITYTILDLPDVVIPPLKQRSTILFRSPVSSPPPAPSPSKRRSPKKTTKRRRNKKDKVFDEVFEHPAILTTRGRRSQRRLFHDEVLAKARANRETGRIPN